MTARLDSLPMAGRFHVDTVTATFDVDVDARIVTVWDAAADAAGVITADQTFMFDAVACRVGAPMVFDVFLIDSDGATHVTTEVLGITPIRTLAESAS